MGECICNSCKNLKAVVSDEGLQGEYECRFGFPSENCRSCNEEECQETCVHYEADDDEDLFVSVKCSSCGKEMTQSSDNAEEGQVFCIDCYLKKCM